MIQQFGSLFEMMEVFGDEQTCIDHLRAIRWADGPFCPYCGSKKVYHFKDGRNHKCGDCRKRFSIKVGTIFEASKIPLRKWFMAIWLLTSHSSHGKGVASAQLARDIRVTQKTAWFMLHRLRHAAQTGSFNEPLKGDVEVDEAYIGGKEANKHASKRTAGTRGRSTKTKTAGGARHRAAGRRGPRDEAGDGAGEGEKIKERVKANAAPGSNLMTDEFAGYAGLGADTGTTP